MKTIIKISNLEINEEEFKNMKSDLEKLIKVEPNEKVIKSSTKMNWSIDQKDIVIMQKGTMLCYRVEFYHNEQEEERKKCYLGSSDYSSPVVI